MDTGHEFYLLCKSCNFKEIIPDLKSIKKNGRPLTKSPKWWCDGIEDADFAYQTNLGWKLTKGGEGIINHAL
jgi:hypothetical protein